jgi:hypothetical protein
VKRFAILLGALACGSGDRTPPADVEVAYGARFDLGQGEQALIGGEARVTFARIAEESRCPAGVRCIRAGNAAAVFGVESPAGTATLTLNTDREPRRAVAAGLALALIGLGPPPVEAAAVDTAAYEATLVVDHAP